MISFQKSPEFANTLMDLFICTLKLSGLGNPFKTGKNIDYPLSYEKEVGINST